MTSVTFDPPRDSAKRGGQHRPATRRGRPPRPALGKVALLVVLAGLVATTASAISVETGSELSGPGGMMMFLGSLTGMVGTYLALVMVLLISRIPVVERILGQDGLVRWHKWLSPWPLSLIGLHAVLITIGYAQFAKSGFLAQLHQFLVGYPDVLAATVGLGLMALAGVVSIRAIRRRLRRETWWVIHLYLYLALALSFAHALALGPSFVGHPLARAVWSVAWLATAGLVIGYRLVLPVVRSVRHGLVVTEVREEAPGVHSIICSGRGLEQLALSGGQFLQWRFLQRHLWWQAHPYSVSALPRPPYIRLTVKSVGDHSVALSRLEPGTRVFFEGPYGAFTQHARVRRKSVLIAGGIGITALRALLEDLPNGSAPAVVVRVSRPDDFALRSEVTELVRHRRGALHEIVGPRASTRFDEDVLRKLVPDLTRRDVYVCGPESFVRDVAAMAGRIGVEPRAIHTEAFGF